MWPAISMTWRAWASGGLEPNELAGFQTRSAELMGALMQRGL